MSHLHIKVGVKKPESEWARPGKPDWPHAFHVSMTQQQALKMLVSIANQLGVRPPEEAGDPVVLDFCGDMETIED